MKTVRWAVSLLAFLSPLTVMADPAHDASQQIKQIQQELDRLREENTKIHSQMESLQQKLSDLQQRREKTDAELEKQVKEARDATPTHINDALDSYWGDHRFLVSGFGFA